LETITRIDLCSQKTDFNSDKNCIVPFLLTANKLYPSLCDAPRRKNHDAERRATK